MSINKNIKLSELPEVSKDFVKKKIDQYNEIIEKQNANSHSKAVNIPGVSTGFVKKKIDQYNEIIEKQNANSNSKAVNVIVKKRIDQHEEIGKTQRDDIERNIQNFEIKQNISDDISQDMVRKNEYKGSFYKERSLRQEKGIDSSNVESKVISEKDSNSLLQSHSMNSHSEIDDKKVTKKVASVVPTSNIPVPPPMPSNDLLPNDDSKLCFNKPKLTNNNISNTSESFPKPSEMKRMSKNRVSTCLDDVIATRVKNQSQDRSL